MMKKMNKMKKILSLVLINLILLSNFAQAADEDYFWTQIEDNLPGKKGVWRSIASSSDGQKLAAVVNIGYIYTSTDGGATWTQQTAAGSRPWISITSSSDGTKLTAAVSATDGSIYTSADSGKTWVERTSAGKRLWYSVTSSSDGTKLAAVTYSGYIYTSADGGNTWTAQTAAGSRGWYSIASSSDGTKLAAVAQNSNVWTSADSGATWIERTDSGSRQWQTIVSSDDGSRLAASSNGYIYTSDNYGETWIQQNGAGGWGWGSLTISGDGKNLAAGTMSSSSGYIYISKDYGVTWTTWTGAGQKQWWAIASSSDGTKLVAGALHGYIYTSSDGGNNWTARTDAGSREWSAITSSSDGTKLAAAVPGDYIYTSNDSGSAWTAHTEAGARWWYSITSSSDGQKLAAVVMAGYIYTSNDGGATWIEQTAAGTGMWWSITSSSDGKRLAAASGNGYIYTASTIDDGMTWNWTQQTGSGYRNWRSITCSSDGTKLAAVTYNGYIYTSSDSGISWIERPSAGSRYWTSITSSSDGKKLAAVVGMNGAGYVYTSGDYGVTWIAQNNSGSRYWQSITSSSDGEKLAVVEGNNGYIYTSDDSGVTWSQLTSAGSRPWVSIIGSSDGTKLVAGSYKAGIFSGLSRSIAPLFKSFLDRDGDTITYRTERKFEPLAAIKMNRTLLDQTPLNFDVVTETDFSDVVMEVLPGGSPYLNISADTNPIAQAINADNTGELFVTASFQNVTKPVIMLNGVQITKLDGTVFPGYEDYIRNVSYDGSTLTFEITHFSEYGVPVLVGQTFNGTAESSAINALGTNLAVNAQNYSVSGTAALDTSRTVQKISGLAYETVLTDVAQNSNYLYQQMVPGQTYGISFEYIQRGNGNDTIELTADLERQNTDNFNIASGASTINYTESKVIAPWQVASFNILVNADNAYSLDVATLNVDVLVNGAAPIVSYNAFANAYAGTFDIDRSYGGENFNYVIMLKAEGYDLQILDRVISVNAPVDYTGAAISVDEIVPGTKIDYSIVIRNNSLSDAVSINIKDIIPGNCHLYYVEEETPTVNGAIVWEWKGATENVAPADDAIWYEITIPGQSVVTASYSVTLD